MLYLYKNIIYIIKEMIYFGILFKAPFGEPYSFSSEKEHTKRLNKRARVNATYQVPCIAKGRVLTTFLLF